MGLGLHPPLSPRACDDSEDGVCMHEVFKMHRRCARHKRACEQPPFFATAGVQAVCDTCDDVAMNVVVFCFLGPWEGLMRDHESVC